MEFCGMKREIDRKCLNHARVHANAQSFLTAVKPLAGSNTGSLRFTDFPSLCACSESSLTNLIGCGLNLLCLQSHSKTECRWTRPEVAILGADQKKRGLWGRECNNVSSFARAFRNTSQKVHFPKIFKGTCVFAL